jgi:hypothetical protein
LITLTFRPVHGETPVLIRGAYFRVGADGTLRGPHNDIVARYRNSQWHLPSGPHRMFDCVGPALLRIVNSNGEATNFGPCQFIKAAEGAIYTDAGRVAIADFRGELASSDDRRQEVVILSSV